MSTTKDARLKPPLKWAGGKRWLVPLFTDFWQPYTDYRLVEPFVGGLAITLGVRPERAWLNDLNPHLINFYKWLQEGLQVEIEMANNEAQYYRHRERFNELIQNGGSHSQEAASLFYYLNRTGYNGLCRFNQKGLFNVPVGRYSRLRYRRDFSTYRPVFRPWTFSNKDFEKMRLEADDFVYADPPYDADFTAYSRHKFDWPEQQRLARWLTNHAGPVVASNHATDRILDLYGGLDFSIILVEAPRRISSDGDRTPALEMIATRNL